ncbi:serine/threonine-protein kinase [Mycobacterium sp. URHB0044]|uniref:serine/threonine-protein kinase n=1 Tax=Mycobacterium sp. URHB0044 TaxID=1380386 RepID=UPI00048AB2CE|nr:serine/threonine-protein kinase [Mycobacterium sp. URHB0044]
MTAPVMLAGRYELRGVLGRGGWAEVHDGWDTRLDRAVAIKLLYARFSADPANRRRFEAEARAAASLSHPNIVAVHDYGEHDGAPFIVMERLPGNTLADAIARGPMPQQLLRDVLADVLAALTAAHDVGILHRDVKPGNILFTTSGHVKVADFGIAKTAGSEPTASGQIMGTMGYVSPDRLEGKPATVLDDVYSVGVLGYEALTGRPPFRHDNMGALARAILSEQPPPILALRPDADPALVAAIDRAMTRDTLHRFQSARQMRAALSDNVSRPLVAGPPAAAVRPPTMVLTSVPPPPATFVPMPPPRRNRPSRKQTLMAVAAVLALILGSILIFADDPPPTPRPVTTSTPVPTTTTTTTTTPPPPTTSAEFEEGPKGPGKDKKGGQGKKGKGEGHGG